MNIPHRALLSAVPAVALAVCSCPPPAAAQGEESRDDPAAHIVAQRQVIASLRAQIDQKPDDPQLWEALLIAAPMSAMMEANLSAGAGETDPGLAARLAQQAFDAVIAEWRSRRPNDAGPYVAEARRMPSGKARDDELLALATRFPEDPAALAPAVEVLRGRGELARVTELLTAFVERHPGDWRGYRLLVGHRQVEGNRTAAMELLARWLDAHPADPRALALLAGTTGGVASSTELRARMAAALPALAELPASAELGQVCHYLAQGDDPSWLEFAETCAQKLLTTATPGLAEQGQNLLAHVAARRRDPARTDELLASLQPSARLEFACAYASQLAASEECDEAVRVLRQVATLRDPRTDAPGQISSYLHLCSANYAAREMLVDLVANASAPELGRQLPSWAPKYNGRYAQDLPLDRLVPLLEARLQKEGISDGLARALDLVYAVGGWSEKRAPLLRRLVATGLEIDDPWRVAEVAEREVAAGRADSATELLEPWVRSHPGDSRAFRQLTELYFTTGKPDRAVTLASQVLTATKEDSIAAEAHWVLARAAVLGRRSEEASRHYLAALAGTHDPRALGCEYLRFLVSTSRDTRPIVAAAEDLCDRQSFRQQSAPDECVAGLLAEELGLVAEADPFWQRALEKAPGSVALYGRAARAAEKGGDLPRAEKLLRQRIGIDPHDEAAWAELGLLFMRTSRVEPHRNVLAEAERALGSPSLLLLDQHATLLLERGEARQAIDLLLQMKKLRPDLQYIDAKLRDAYQLLGEKGGRP